MKFINVYKLEEDAFIPSRSRPTDCGLDLFALEDTFIPVDRTVLLKTGIGIEIPEGYVGKVEDRSSMALKGLRVGAGIIDPGYAGSCDVVLHNLTCRTDTNYLHTLEGYQVKRGDKIAQLLLIAVATPVPNVVNELWMSDRASNGWGSSGR